LFICGTRLWDGTKEKAEKGISMYLGQNQFWLQNIYKTLHEGNWLATANTTPGTPVWPVHKRKYYVSVVTTGTEVPQNYTGLTFQQK
jgi:hypothetical protein